MVLFRCVFKAIFRSSNAHIVARLKGLTTAIASQLMEIDIINDFSSHIFGIKTA